MRKGITPIIGVVMLSLMTIAAAGTVYTLYQNMQNQARGQETHIQLTNVKIEQCWRDGGNTYLKIRNSNPESIKTDYINVYTNGSPESNYKFSDSNNDGIVDPQEDFTLRIDYSVPRSTLIRIATESSKIDYRC